MDSIKHEVNFKNYKLYGIDSYEVSSKDYINVNIIFIVFHLLKKAIITDDEPYIYFSCNLVSAFCLCAGTARLFVKRFCKVCL